jgi:nitrogen fixation protein NifU and related proteins
MSGLEQLYQQVILDHARERHGHGLREASEHDRSADSHQVNALCGDEVTMRVILEESNGQPTVKDVAWVGDGCSISQASISVLHDLVVDQPVPQARELVETFRAMIRARGSATVDEDVLGDAVAFHGVGRHTNRVKCAMLGWSAFEDALNRLGTPRQPQEGTDE